MGLETCSPKLLFSVGLSYGCSYQYSVLYKGYCYFGNTVSLTWNDAKSYCQDQNAHLVDIQSMADVTAVRNVFGTSFLKTWIGLNDIAQEDVWVWDLGRSTRNVSYTNWINGEPNNVDNDEDCVQIYLRTGGPIYGDLDVVGMLNDAECSEQTLSICKKGRYL